MATWKAAMTRRNQMWIQTRKTNSAGAAGSTLSHRRRRLSKSNLNTTWERLMRMAIKEEIISLEQRLDLHDLKRRGITDTKSRMPVATEARP
ncbi:hypothetical protein [Larsenimonas suaedae]|uniref:DUF1127 domain-containing protein n=1 Tax=Larsenimonas suaedae TaxID=1851019 RepID=A0ABU1GWF7_9GAMM|nr:hypothetical protein [Larsenimonas suaedae]MCM2973450.1 hypothetical protein [Larsenimonas suaedae]MDR5896343.1 hypothetical protein [Larsenimonas suaedae]